MNAALEARVIAQTHRIPLPDEPAGDAAVAVRQFDVVAMSAGFNLSRIIERDYLSQGKLPSAGSASVRTGQYRRSAALAPTQ